MRLGSTVVRSLREGALWVFGALALIVFAALASYDRNDPSFATTGEPGPISNVIGPLGAHLSGLLVLLFGAPSFLFPIMIGFAGWLLYQDRSKADAPSRATVAFRVVGFVLTLVTSCGLASLHFTVDSYPDSAGGVLGSMVGDGLAAGLSFLGATLLMLALWLAGVSLFAGVSWIEIMDRTGRATLGALEWVMGRISRAREIKAGREVKEARSEVIREEKRRVASRPPPKIEPVVQRVEKSERVEKERQVAMFDRPTAKELPALSLLDDAPSRQAGYSAEALEAMSRLVELKLRDFGVEAEVVAVHPGPVITRFELQPAPGVKVSQISALAKDLARALSVDQRAGRRSDSGQVDGGPRDPEREARAGHARRDHQVEDLRRNDVAAHAGARQGHQRRAGRRRPRAHAAPARRRHHRLGQVDGRQCDGAVAAVQGDAPSTCA